MNRRGTACRALTMEWALVVWQSLLVLQRGGRVRAPVKGEVPSPFEKT